MGINLGIGGLEFAGVFIKIKNLSGGKKIVGRGGRGVWCVGDWDGGDWRGVGIVDRWF